VASAQVKSALLLAGLYVTDEIVIKDLDLQGPRLASEYKAQGFKVGIMAKEENQNKYNGFEVKVIGKGTELEICAANLFAILRSFDKEGFEIIIAEGLEEQGLGLAIMERLRKAAAKK